MKESKTVNNTLGQLLLVLVIIFLLSLNNLHSAGWFNYNWNYRKMITFTDSSDSIPSPQENFPALIKITDNDLIGKPRTDGFDILFTDSDGITQLSHEIELYEPDTGLLVSWIKIPVLDTGTIIYMYYGNDVDTDQQDIHNVWDDNFVGVWHKNDSNALTIKDSSGNNNHGEKKSSDTVDPQEALGKIGYSQFYDDTVYIELGTNSMPRTDEAMTFEAWAYYINNPTTENLVLISNKSNASVQLGFRNNAVTVWKWGGTTLVTSVLVDADLWHHYVFKTDGVTHYLYINGIEADSSTVNLQNGEPLEVRINTDSWNEHFSGYIDEVRISNIARSANWIKTSYHNQNDPLNFLNIGSEVIRPEISINYPDDNYETEVINITVSGTAANCYIGDTLKMFVDNVLQDSAILNLPDTMWSFNITLLNPSDSILIKLTNIYNDVYSDTITITKLPPDTPAGIDATAILQGSDTGVLLIWSHNTDPDTAGYNIYRTSDSSDFSDTINIDLITDTNYFLDTTVVQGETYFYKITCVDKVGNESPQSDSITASSVKIKLSVDTYGRTLPGDTLTLYFNYYNDGFGPAYGANLFYNIPNNLIFDTFVSNVNNVSDTYIESLQRLQWKFNSPILPKLESDSKNLGVILKIK